MKRSIVFTIKVAFNARDLTEASTVVSRLEDVFEAAYTEVVNVEIAHASPDEALAQANRAALRNIFDEIDRDSGEGEDE